MHKKTLLVLFISLIMFEYLSNSLNNIIYHYVLLFKFSLYLSFIYISYTLHTSSTIECKSFMYNIGMNIKSRICQSEQYKSKLKVVNTYVTPSIKNILCSIVGFLNGINDSTDNNTTNSTINSDIINSYETNIIDNDTLYEPINDDIIYNSFDYIINNTINDIINNAPNNTEQEVNNTVIDNNSDEFIENDNDYYHLDESIDDVSNDNMSDGDVSNDNISDGNNKSQHKVVLDKSNKNKLKIVKTIRITT